MTQRATSQGQADTIKNETTPGANTANRVGTALRQLADQAAFTEDLTAYVQNTAQVVAGSGLSGGGAFSAGNPSLACSFGSSAGTVCQGNDSRLSDARTPTTHATSHKSGGSDAIKLNELAAPTAAVAFNNQDETGIKTSTLNGVIDDGNSGTSKTIDWTQGAAHKLTLTGNVTLTFTAPSGPCWLQLRLTQDGTGSRTVTWPSMKWAGGGAPTLTTTATTGTDIVSIWYDGSAYYGAALLNFV